MVQDVLDSVVRLIISHSLSPVNPLSPDKYTLQKKGGLVCYLHD